MSAEVNEKAGVLQLVKEFKAHGKLSVSDDADYDENEDIVDVVTIVGTDREVQALVEIKALVAKEATLSARTDCTEALFLRCLRTRRYDVPKTLKLLHDYCGLCDMYELDKLTIASVRKAAEQGFLVLAEGARDKLGRQILYLRFRFNNPKLISAVDNLRFAVYAINIACQSVDTQVNGIFFVHDFGGVRVGNFDPKARIIQDAMQDKMPVRLAGIAMLHAPWYFSIIFNIVKRWLRPKLRKRTNVLKDAKKICEYIDNDNLLEDYGGTRKFDVTSWIRHRYEVEGIPYTE